MTTESEQPRAADGLPPVIGGNRPGAWTFTDFKRRLKELCQRKKLNAIRTKPQYTGPKRAAGVTKDEPPRPHPASGHPLPSDGRGAEEERWKQMRKNFHEGNR